MHRKYDRLHYVALFIWQLLVWSSCSFFVGTYFLQNHTVTPRHDHHRIDTLEGWERSSRETMPTNKDLVDNELSALLWQIRSPEEHSAASISEQTAKQKYAELCSVYSTHCLSTRREWSYDRTQKYLYQWLSIVLMQQIDKRLSSNKKTQDILSELKIYQNDEERRWSAGHTNIKINSKKIPTNREYREVLTHELWHIIDLGVLQWSSYTKNRSFTEFGKVMRSKDDPSIPFYQISRISESTRKAEASYKDFVSWYAMKWIYEDFAETKNLWFNHNLLFQELAKENSILEKKYSFFKNLYGNQRFDDHPASVTLAQVSKRAWDTTKIQ